MSAVATPRWFPQRYDAASDSVLLVEQSEADFRAAAFLDERSLSPDTPSHLVPWATVAGAVPPDARRDIQYIFHIGHVGSTLISRLLGELPDVLALREPQILRDIVACLEDAVWETASIPARLDVLTALLSRTFRPGQRAMVKATSFVSEIAAELVPSGSKALLVYASPRRWMETILAGENSRATVRATAEIRLARLHRRSGDRRWNLGAMDEGETIAMAWAAEMASLASAAEKLPQGATMWMDFDSFLAAPASGLLALAGYFGIELNDEGAEALARHPLLSRYSKALEHPFGPHDREALLAEARRDHSAALASGARWLEQADAESPAIAQCLAMASG